MTNETCPHCGAQRDKENSWLCGTYEYISSDGLLVWQSHRCCERQIEQLQARIDELMFEHCPDEMTNEQIKQYADAKGIFEEDLVEFGYASGDYSHKCTMCDSVSNDMDKRAIRCYTCAVILYIKVHHMIQKYKRKVVEQNI